MQSLKTATPECRPMHLKHKSGQFSPARLVGVALTGALLLVGCSTAEETSGQVQPTSGSADETTGSEHERPPRESTSREGLIDVNGGYTQDEQLAELEIVVDIMQEHFGEDVATIDGEPWTAERHDAEVAPRPQNGDMYRHAINFDLELTDLEEAYATADEIAKELGLTENLNNSNGIGRYGGIYYGAGREEGRIFILKGGPQEGGGVRYRTQRSDDETIIYAYEHVLETNRQEREEKFGPDNHRQMEDLEIKDE